MKTITKNILIAFLALNSFNGHSQNKDKKVHHFTVDQVIEAPAEKVWETVGVGYADIYKYHAGITSSDYLEGSTHAGEGCERVCNLNESGSKYIHEKQVDYNEEQKSFKVQVFRTEGLPTVPDYTFANYRVEKIDESTSRLVIDMTYRTKPAFLGGVAKGKFKKLMSEHATFVAHYTVTGEEVNKDNKKDILKQYN